MSSKPSRPGELHGWGRLGDGTTKGPPPRSRTVATMLGLLRAAHPAPAGAVTVVSTALAVASGRDLRGCLLVALAVLTGQLSIGWSNDRIDLPRDVAAQRRDKPLTTGAAQAPVVGTAAGCALVLCIP